MLPDRIVMEVWNTLGIGAVLMLPQANKHPEFTVVSYVHHAINHCIGDWFKSERFQLHC